MISIGNKLANAAFVAMIAGFALWTVGTAPPPLPASAAVDCNSTAALRIEIVDVGHPERNGGLLSFPGALLHFNRNPQNGALSGITYADNGSLDDEKSRLGAVEEKTACTSTGDDYTVSLSFLSILDCLVIGPDTIKVNVGESKAAEFIVDDCEPVATPSPSPAATSTALPATATPAVTASLVPTSTATAVPAQVIVVERLVTATAQPAPVLTTVPQLPVIRPPSTGDGGLLK